MTKKPQTKRNCMGCAFPIDPCAIDNGMCMFASSHSAGAPMTDTQQPGYTEGLLHPECVPHGCPFRPLCAERGQGYSPPCSRPHTPAPEQYKMQTDEDGAIGKVAICLCDQCKVNGFLCTKSSRAITPYIPGKETPNTYRCCEVCPNVPCKPLFRVNCTRQDPEAIARTATLAFFKRSHQATYPNVGRCKRNVR
jgi:hypothetical protein